MSIGFDPSVLPPPTQVHTNSIREFLIRERSIYWSTICNFHRHFVQGTQIRYNVNPRPFYIKQPLHAPLKSLPFYRSVISQYIGDIEGSKLLSNKHDALIRIHCKKNLLAIYFTRAWTDTLNLMPKCDVILTYTLVKIFIKISCI